MADYVSQPWRETTERWGSGKAKKDGKWRMGDQAQNFAIELKDAPTGMPTLQTIRRLEAQKSIHPTLTR